MDLVMLLNFIVDFLLLLGTNRLSGFPAQPGRCALSAVLGAVYSGACLLPGFRFLSNLLWRTVCLGAMGVIAFGCSRSALKRGGVFLILSMALGGVALSVGRGDFLSVCLCAALLWLLCRVAFGDGVGQQSFVPITITQGGRTVSLTALRDTGNTLRDPVSGEPVLVISGELAARLTGLTPEQLRHPLETIAGRAVPGLRLIPYRAVGCGGVLLAMRFSDVKIGTRRRSVMVAFAPEGLGRENTYQGLTGGAL